MRRKVSIADRQHGVVARTQLLRDGWSSSRIDREVRSGHLLRMQGLSGEVCVVVVTDSALVAGKDTDDHSFYL